MAYIGVSPSNGVRRVHTYTATASQTTFSGAGAEGTSLSYKDSNFVDVYQNGIKLGDADYTSTSGTSIVLAQGASVDDLVVVVVFDVFSVADTVSKADGGTFDGNVTMGGTLTVSGAFTSLGIDDNADATAVTIDSNENVCIGVTSKNSSNNGSLTIGHTGMTKVSASASGNADELVIVGEDGSANAGMSIISNNANQGSIFFGDEDDTDIGKIVYDHSEDSMKMFTGTVEIVKLSSGATVFNNGGANMDFRVEGDTQAELFFIDAGSDFVGIGHSNYYSGKLSIFFDADSDNERGITLTPQNNTCTYLHFHNSGASTVGSITGNGSNTAFNTSSDYRLKEN